MEVCEHGKSFHCQSCEIKYLRYVIEKKEKEMNEMDHYYNKEITRLINKNNHLIRREKK